MNNTEFQSVVSDSNPRWFQYSLRTLLLFVTACAIACSWLAVKMQQAERQREAAAAIQRLGGYVRYDYQFDASGEEIPSAVPPSPTWLRNLFGNDLFDSVVEVVAWRDEQVEHIKLLPNLQSLDFLCGIGVTDAGLAHLQEVPHLRRLRFGGSKHVTHAGLANLGFLTQLQRLDMSYLRMTDADLEYVQELTQMEELWLSEDITDAGLVHLRGLTKLKMLEVMSTEVTDEGVKTLQQALPNCKIVR